MFHKLTIALTIDWIKTPEGWKMATDIALPVPPPPSGAN
jgi:hypothetical protein